MKKQLVIAGWMLVLAASSSLYASTARLLALGMNETDNDGMHLIQDDRNIFLNPAYVNLYPDRVNLEFGNHGLYVGTDTAAATATAATVWQKQTPKAQGGVFKKYGDYVFGAYFGNESNTSGFLRLAATSTASALNRFVTTKASKMLQTADNQLDLYFGSEGTVKWGGSFIFAKGADEARSEKNISVATRFGVIASDWETSISLSLASKAHATDYVSPLAGVSTAPDETVRQEFDGNIGVQFAGAYNLTSQTKIYGYVKHFAWDQYDSYSKYTTLRSTANGSGNATVIATVGTSGQNGKVSGDFTHYYLGLGHEMAVGDQGKLFLSLVGRKIDINMSFASRTEVRNIYFPLTVGYEMKAKDWLVLRGSVIQYLYGVRDNKKETNVNAVAKSLISQTYGADGKSTIPNTTAVNTGIGLLFGNLTVDGLVGTSGPTGTAAENKGILSLSNLETSVALSYKF